MKYAIIEDRIVVAVFMYENQRDICCTELMCEYPSRCFTTMQFKEV